MATPAPLLRPGVSRAAAILLTAAAAVTVAALPASAAPVPAGPAATDPAAMAARAHDLEQLTEAFNAARDQLAAQQSRARSAQAAVTAAQATLAADRTQLVGVARSAYTDGNAGALSALLTSSSANQFMDQVSTLDVIAGHSDAVIGQAAAAARAATAAQAQAARDLGAARATYDRVAAQEAALQKQVSAYSQAFAGLSAADKTSTLAAAEGSAGAASRGVTRTAPAGSVVAPTHAAQVAVDTALAQLGKPYVWAAAGPNSFDCSGLMLFAYAAAGVALPHSAAGQARLGTPVSTSQLSPGDLVFYYSPISHVGMYIGNGQIVNAPTAGDVVKIVGIDAAGTPTALRRIAG